MDTPSTGIDSLTARFTPGRPAVVCYVPLGDPSVPAVELLDAYADAGVDVLEIGVPTADPWLDGPEVTESMARALAAGTDPRTSARVLAAWRRGRVAAGAAVPIILWFGYPELALETVRTAAWEGAIDALLLIDPWRHPEGASLDAALRELGVARCAFMPWEPGPEDAAWASTATGYVMVQARPGVTGAGGPPADPAALVRRARSMAPGRPVVAGFGIEGAADVARLLGTGVDGVVVGSAGIRALRDGGTQGLRAFLRPIVAAARAHPSVAPA